MARNVTIYKGNIRKLYASDVVMQDDSVVPIVKEEIVTDQAFFTFRLHKFTNLEYGTILFTEDEAVDYMTRVVEGGTADIASFLEKPDVTEEEKKAFFQALKSASSCLFVNPDEIKPSHRVTRKEYKQLKKSRFIEKYH